MKIYDLVKKILEKNELARESDKWLYLEVLKELEMVQVRRSILGTQVFVKNWEEIPQFESVTRARRKLQELYPKLRGKNYKAGARREKEESKGTFVFREEV